MAPPTWAPTPQLVGAIMPARFPRRASGAAGPGVDTIPTSQQILDQLELLAPDLLEEVGLEDWGDDTFDTLGVRTPTGALAGWADAQRASVEKLARTALTFRCAALIENGFFPEQSDTDAGPAEYFRRRAQEQTDRLRRKLVTLGRAELAP